MSALDDTIVFADGLTRSLLYSYFAYKALRSFCFCLIFNIENNTESLLLSLAFEILQVWTKRMLVENFTIITLISNKWTATWQNQQSGCAPSEDSDQTGRMPRLIWVFAGCTVTLLVLSCRGSNVMLAVLTRSETDEVGVGASSWDYGTFCPP